MRQYYMSVEGINVDPSGRNLLVTSKYEGIAPLVDFDHISINSNAKCSGSIYTRKTLTIEPGVVVNGPILSLDSIILRTGNMENVLHPTIIVGDICALGEFKVEKISDDDTPLIIYGNIQARSVELKGKVFVRGNVFVTENFTSTEESFIAGEIRAGLKESDAKVTLANTTFVALHAYGEVEFLHKNSSLMPIVIATRKINVSPETQIRILSDKCFTCNSENPFLCNKYFEATCGDYEYLYEKDLMDYKSEKVLSWYWRTNYKVVVNHFLTNQIQKNIYKKIRSNSVSSFNVAKYNYRTMLQEMYKDLMNFPVTTEKVEKWLAEQLNTTLEAKFVKRDLPHLKKMNELISKDVKTQKIEVLKTPTIEKETLELLEPVKTQLAITENKEPKVELETKYKVKDLAILVDKVDTSTKIIDLNDFNFKKPDIEFNFCSKEKYQKMAIMKH